MIYLRNSFLSHTAMAFLAIAVLASACKRKKEEEKEEEQPEYDRTALLANLADNLILPAYAVHKLNCDSLALAAAAFTANPDSITCIELRNSHFKAWTSWQNCSVYEIGPALNITLRAAVNTFPADTTQINTNITSGSYNLATASNLDAKGFPGLDFLLYPPGKNVQQTVTMFANNVNRKQYLNDLVNEIQGMTAQVYDAWRPDLGNYSATFKASTGTDVGSSFGMLINQLNYDYEIIKTAKVAIPLGKMTLGSPLPEKVEALYCGRSAELANVQLLNLEGVFLGRTQSGANGTGIDDYLDYIEADYNGIPLSNAIINGFSAAKTALGATPDPLNATILSNPVVVENAYVKLQQLLVLLKGDMPSALGVLITYQDNDGD